MHCVFLCIFASIGTVLSYVPSEAVNALAFHPTMSYLAVGTIAGNLLLFSSNSDIEYISTTSVGSDGVIGRMEWAPSLYHLAVLVVHNRVEILHFSDLSTGTVDATMVLLHTFPVTAVGWVPVNPDAPVILVGTMNGYIDKYTVVGSPILESGRDFRRYVGCQVTFFYPYGSDNYIYGCNTGRLGKFTLEDSVPSVVLDLSPVAMQTAHAIFQPAGNSIVAMIKEQVFVVAVSDLTLTNQFSVFPYRVPRIHSPWSDLVMDFAVSVDVSANPKSLAVRTADGIFIYDIAGIISATVATSSWVTDLSLADLRAAGIFDWSTVSSGWESDPSDPQVEYSEVDDPNGTLDFSACWNSDADFYQLGDKSQIVCSPELGNDSLSLLAPTVGLDIWLTSYQFTKVRGSFNLISLGGIPAMDCSLGKVPLTSWSSDQRSSWNQALGSSSTDLTTDCLRMNETPILSSQLLSVADCKSACEARPECNTIFVKKLDPTQDFFYVADSDRGIDVCNFYLCPNPEFPPMAPNDNFEVWSFVSSEREWTADVDNRLFGGYVAFGTAEEVLYGGCASIDGLIQSDTPTVVTIPETTLHVPSSTLKFQVSQYNAEARVRVFDLAIDVFVSYPPSFQFIEEPFTAPGNYLYQEVTNAGSAAAPVVFSLGGLGIIYTQQDTSVAWQVVE